MSKSATNDGVILDTNAALDLTAWAMSPKWSGKVFASEAKKFLRTACNNVAVRKWLRANEGTKIYATETVLYEIRKVLDDNNFTSEFQDAAVNLWERFCRDTGGGVIEGTFPGHKPPGTIGVNLGRNDLRILAAASRKGMRVVSFDQDMADFANFMNPQMGVEVVLIR